MKSLPRLLFALTACACSAAAAPDFSLVAREASDVAAHPADPGRMILASRDHLFEFDAREKVWKPFLDFRTGEPIRKIFSFPRLPDQVFILSREGVFAARFSDPHLSQIFFSKASGSAALAFELTRSGEWLVGTERGLERSRDRGQTWQRVEAMPAGPVCALRETAQGLLAAAPNRLYYARDLGSFEPVFSLPSEEKEPPEISERPEDPAGPEEEPSTAPCSIFSLTSSGSGKVWAVTRRGIFGAPGAGGAWTRLASSGLPGGRAAQIVYSEKNRALFAAATAGVYRFEEAQGLWRHLDRGGSGEARALVLVQGLPEILAALTSDGLIEIPLGEDLEFSGGPGPDKLALFGRLLAGEPSCREIQKAVVRYNDLSNGKIRRWHAASRLAALVPSLSLGRSRSSSNNIDIDRAGTSNPDVFISGPDNLSRHWNFDARWNLGDFLWSSSQTSIDSRSKIMAEFRNDLTAEATRLYFERRRLQTEIAFRPAASPEESAQRQIRLEELTALLDGMTGGFLSQRLAALYRRDPNLAGFTSEPAAPGPAPV